MRKALLLSALSAILSALSFAPYNLWPVGFISLLPVFSIFENCSLKRRQIIPLWLVWILVLNIIGYHWIMHTIAVYGMMPQVVAVPLFLLYSLGTGSKMLFFFFILHFMAQRRELFGSIPLRGATIVAAFAICEFVGWQLFPWYGANLVSGNLYFAQAADLIGTRGLSLLWILVQYLAFNIYHDYLKMQKKWRDFFAQSKNLHVLGSVLLIVHIYGVIQVKRYSQREEKAAKIIVGVPQGNVPLITGYHERPYIIARMVAQTQRLIGDAAARNEKVDLIIWPESSIPAMEYERSSELRRAIESLQNETRVPIVINDIYHEPTTGKDYSNMWLLDEQGRQVASYQKNFLLPFGEFMPMGDLFPALKRLFPAVSDFAPGARFSIFSPDTRHGRIHAMPLICYEVILPDYARRFDSNTEHKAQFIINITNDAWFGDSYESLQHMTLGVMRAIELRLPIVRATNSGISAYIASTGEVSAQTPLFERVNRVYPVPVMERERSLYALFGNWPLVAYCACTILVLLWRNRARLRRI